LYEDGSLDYDEYRKRAQKNWEKKAQAVEELDKAKKALRRPTEVKKAVERATEVVADQVEAFHRVIDTVDIMIKLDMVEDSIELDEAKELILEKALETSPEDLSDAEIRRLIFQQQRALLQRFLHPEYGVEVWNDYEFDFHFMIAKEEGEEDSKKVKSL
jgi:hypothetical protein